MSRNRRIGEPSVDCLLVSYKTWAVWDLDDRRRTRGSWVPRFLRTFGPCNDQTSWVSYDWISSRDPGVGWRILIIFGPGGPFLGNPWVLDPEVLSWTHEPGIKVLKGPHSAILGEATLGTCWGIAFYRSEAGHCRVPVLHAAFCRKPLSGLEGAGVGSASFLRLETAVETRFMPRPLVFGDHCLLLMKVFSTFMKRVVTFIHWSNQVRRSPAWLSVSILRL
ncbi:hypothetical protein F2Q69_00021932 [Brassica cretica]|uniref:Uncharacterized protein n=1 Tax=Brassica cretica TaxID=69181 RepID=A0A8S9QL64_BRACR|nr:hypothetical protein F2Q69_00021932 [Brassica cretica]